MASEALPGVARGFEPFLEFMFGHENVPTYLHTEKLAVRTSIRSLVVETKVSAPKGDELLFKYSGREDVLFRQLEKMKSKQEMEASQIEEIKSLVEETKAPKVSAKHMQAELLLDTNM